MRVSLALGLLAPVAHAVQTGVSPLVKVLTLLEKMSTEIEKEMEQDAAVSKKMQCWAATNRNEKTAAIAENEALVSAKNAEIKDLTARIAQLEVTVKDNKKDLAEDEEQLAKLEETRKKEGAAFQKFETDTVKAIEQLRGALTVLKKHKSLAEVRAVLSKLNLDSTSTPKVMSLLETGTETGSVDEIYGVLSQMSDDMQAELKDRRAEEAGDVAKFNAMRKSKKEEIANDRAELQKNTDALASAKESLARAKKLVKETNAILEADRKFLADLEVRAKADLDELAARQAAQNEELQALKETKDILNTDEARDLTRKTLKPVPSFLQTRTRQEIRSRRQQASEVLARVPGLSLLATRVQLDAFENVKKMISNLIEELKTKKQDEVVKRDYCVKSFDENDVSTDAASNKAEDLGGLKTKLENDIAKLTKSISDSKSAIDQLKVDIQAAGYDRQAQNAVYQQTHTDQTVTMAILQKAINRLHEFYGDKGLMQLDALLQQPGAPAGLTKDGYKKKNGGGVIGMIRMIMTDSEKALAEATTDEKNAQAAYEGFLSDSKADYDAKVAKVVSDSKAKAETEEDLLQCKADLKATMGELEALGTAKKNLHAECDFLMQNFDNRQAALGQEIEALQQAISILSGAQ